MAVTYDDPLVAYDELTVSYDGATTDNDTWSWAADANATTFDHATDVIGAKPVLYWKFNETSGTTATDSSGNGRNGTIGSGITVNQTGYYDKAFKFDGTKNANVSLVADGNNWGLTTGICIDVTLKFNAVNNNPRIVEKNVSGSAATFVIYMNNAVTLDWSISGSFEITWATGGYLADGGWHQIRCTYDNTTARIYVDGVQRQSGAGSAPMNIAAGDFTVGETAEWSGDGFNFNALSGTIDEIAIYSASPPAGPRERDAWHVM